MTLPALIRVFFAVDLPEKVKEDLGKYIKELKKQAKSQNIRWTKAENLHITLQFLAEVKSLDLPMLSGEVRKTLQTRIKQTAFSCGELHLFPSPYRPRVIVLDVNPQEGLTALADAIGNALDVCAYPKETRPFRGHLTLGRIKQPHGANLNFIAECIKPVLEPIKVEEVILFRSEPQDNGSKYTVLERIPLEA